MNDRNNALAKAVDRSGAQPSHDWLMPVTPEFPCGADLEYDPEFIVLAGRIAAKSDAQYGDFVGVAEQVNWGEVDRECRRLMMRSKDIRLAVIFTRCRTRLTTATGLAEGLRVLSAWLAAFPEDVHPQLSVDTDRDAALEIRMNALQALTDTDGLLSDIREISLTKSSATRLQLRDVERAFAHPRPSDALAPESVSLQLGDLSVQQPALFSALDEAVASVGEIEAWARSHLEGYEPDFSPLRRILRHVSERALPASGTANEASLQSVEVVAAEVSDGGVAHEPALENQNIPLSQAEASFVATRIEAGASGREEALNAMRAARHWFEQYEPSSPIPVLLRRAEHCVGKRYAELLCVVPSELIAQWENE